MTRNIRTEGNAFETGLVRDAMQRLRRSASLAPEIDAFDALGVDLIVRFPHDQTEDGLLSWHDGTAIASLAQRYTQADLDRLPAVLAHEILGHALWEGRAQRQRVHAAVRFHLDGELTALATGWIAALELGLKPLHPAMLSDFASDPAAFAHDLPLLSSHYVLLLSTPEMQHARRTLQDRLNILTQEWIDLRSVGLSAAEVEARERSLTAMIRLLTQTLGRLDREDDQASERWFAAHASCDLVQELGRSTALMVDRLQTWCADS